MKLQFQFTQFKPSRELARSTEGLMFQLADVVPPETSVSTKVSRVKKRYLCLVQVKTPHAQFMENATCANPVTGIGKVGDKIKKDILGWQVDHLTVNEPSFWNFKELKF